MKAHAQKGRGFVMSSCAKYQDCFAREQSLELRRSEWEDRLAPPLQTYWDRALAGLFFGLALAGAVYLLTVGL